MTKKNTPNRVDSLSLAIAAEKQVREAMKTLAQAAEIERSKQCWEAYGALQYYANQLANILVDDHGDTGLESLVRKLGGI